MGLTAGSVGQKRSRGERHDNSIIKEDALAMGCGERIPEVKCREGQRRIGFDQRGREGDYRLHDVGMDAALLGGIAMPPRHDDAR